ncbi:hypothetical protein GCM10011579_008710 [Streptomyces albiflavescens]|uniref:HTH cro/C1-type domain-containing protein n=1 Tax=Streptomyces albiflavescens TaxID=1623582 RepID=A0A917XSU5_9ACTN|nr:helix-turn-helix transcriptional regulator [Streptomyces albiflavescens]GGN52098.1 hypothetical protein GCM10011579_008710 [Streptomyces albiflavescens]
MGRPECPVDHSAPARGRLAQHLRRHRELAQLTYGELARRTGRSAATLKRAASGKTVPRLSTVEAYITGCADDADAVQAATALWRAARIEERGRLGALRAPRPELIGDAGDLSNALEVLYENAGAPSLRELRERSGNLLALPVSSAARIVNRKALPADAPQLKAFLTGCGLSAEQHGPWERAWKKIASRRTAGSTAGTAALPSPGSAHQLLPSRRPARADWSEFTAHAYPPQEENHEPGPRRADAAAQLPARARYRLVALKELLEAEAQRNGVTLDAALREAWRPHALLTPTE